MTQRNYFSDLSSDPAKFEIPQNCSFRMIGPNRAAIIMLKREAKGCLRGRCFIHLI